MGDNVKKFRFLGFLIGGMLSQKAGFSDWCVIKFSAARVAQGLSEYS